MLKPNKKHQETETEQRVSAGRPRSHAERGLQMQMGHKCGAI